MTALVNREPNEVVPYEGQLPSDGNEDIPTAYPIISIVQPMSQIQKAIPGFFHHSDTDEQTDSFEGVLLFRKETRALFIDGDDQPVCRSNDGIVPVHGGRIWEMKEFKIKGQTMAPPPVPSKTCGNCPFSDWGDGVPPACGNAYAVLAARNGNPDDLVQLRLKGTSLRPFNQWVGKMKHAKLRMYQHVVHLTTEEKTGPSRKWHQLVIQSDPLDMETVLEYAALLGQAPQINAEDFGAEDTHFDDSEYDHRTATRREATDD